MNVSARGLWDEFKAFWTAEEIPRWFGLTLVLVYLAGLGAIVHVGMRELRRHAQDRVDELVLAAVDRTVEELRASGQKLDARDDIARHWNLALFELAGAMHGATARVLDARHKVIASTDPLEIGMTIPDPVLSTDPLSSGQAGRIHRERDSVTAWRALEGVRWEAKTKAGSDGEGSVGTATGVGATPLVLMVRYPAIGSNGGSLAGQAEAAAIVLLAFGVLLVAYRCVRGQLRGPVKIAERLRLHGNRLRSDTEQVVGELAMLRLSEAEDTATGAWNALVDLAQNLANAVARNEANAELKNALERSGGGALAEALHALPDGIMFLRAEEQVDYANASAARLMGWRGEDIRNMTLSKAPRLSKVGERIAEIVRSAQQADGTCVAMTETVESGEGTGADQSSYRVWVIPVHRPHALGECLVVIRDVSQQLRAEKAREEFVTQVTHELRTPLTNIRAYAETLSSGMFEDPSVITECYNVITKETRRLSRLIEDILSVSQLEVGGIDLQVDTVDLRQVLSEGVRDVRGLADEKNIDIQLVLPSKLEPIRGDRDKLAVVVNNLLGNAIKYTPSGGDVLLGCQVSSSEVIITVKDNGFGIDPEDHARVFEKFQRGRDPEVQAESGTGIGLYTSREIVRRHGGNIELISRKGEGSTFLVKLPNRESRATTLSLASAET
ncbi:MAG: PAS domain-containing protein [Phycisphaerae bacterium]|nr:PAS domain-containing protein [Phycisphaerae bacterium]